MSKSIKNSKGSQGLEYSPVNYSTASSDLAGHIKGIDDALGNSSGGSDYESGNFQPTLTYEDNASAPPTGGTVNHGFYIRVGKIVQGMVNVRLIVGTINTDSYFRVSLPKTPSKIRAIMMGNHGTFYSDSKGGVVDFASSGSNEIRMKVVKTEGGSNELVICELSFCYELV